MNSNTFNCLIITVFVLVFLPFCMHAQNTISVENYNKLSVSGACKVYLKSDMQQANVVTIKTAIPDGQEIRVSRGTLYLKGKKGAEYIVYPQNITEIEVAGIAVVLNEDQLSFPVNDIEITGTASLNVQISGVDKLKIDQSGASKTNLNLKDVKLLDVDISGACSMYLSGNANEIKMDQSGVCSVNTRGLIVDRFSLDASGAGNTSVNAKNVNADLSGTSSLTYKSYPNQKVRIDKSITNNVKVFDGNVPADTIQDTNDAESIEVKEESYNYNYPNDDEWRNMHKSFNKWLNRRKFDGHWAGFEMAVNGYGKSGFTTSLPGGYEDMEQDFGHSFQYNINLFEHDFVIGKGNCGIVTGLGMTFNNYRFHDKNIVPTTENGYFEITHDNTPNRGYTKSKLGMFWLRVPVLFEWQSDHHRWSNFYASVGVVGSVKLSSNTKQKYNENGKQTVKDFDDFYLNPFKAEVEARVGVGCFGVVASYGFTEMFRNNKGPKLYPFSIGLSLLF